MTPGSTPGATSGGVMAVGTLDSQGRPVTQSGVSGGPMPGINPGAMGRGGAGGPAASGGNNSGSGSNSVQSSGTTLESPACTASIATGEVPVSAFGGVVELRVQLKPAGCRPTLGSSGNWILLASGAQQADLYRFSVSPNISNSPRIGVVVLGDQKILIKQAATAGARFAVSPGHVAISVNAEKAPAARVISIYSDDKTLTYTVASSQSWLQVTPVAKASKAGDQRFQILVDPLRLRPGRNEASVRVSATGQPGVPLIVPVVVEVPKVR